MQKPTLFDRLGGIRKMADLLGKPPSTVQSWKNAGRVPSHEQHALIEKARAAGHDLAAEDVVYPMGLPADASASAVDAEAEPTAASQEAA